jgi:hypothetical protein
MSKYFLNIFIAIIASFIVAASASGQVSDPEKIKKMIKSYKLDPRGPYLDIRWFCMDGSTRPARDPCPDTPGNQRARYKPAVNELAKKQHIFLGQILTKTPYSDFWDENNAYSRYIQYQLEQYLRSIDNGWINRKAQYYRGAIQNEDENNWGIGFYTWVLSDTQRVKSKYYLLRQSALYIPHSTDDKNAQSVRSLSREIADSLTDFQDLRIKIHNMPDAGDLDRVRSYVQKNKGKIPAKLTPKFDRLIQELIIMYKPFRVNELDKYIKKLPKNSDAASIASAFVKKYPGFSNAEDRCMGISHTALLLRKELSAPMSGQARLAIIDIINRLEGLLNVQITQWDAQNLKALTAQLHCLAEAAAAFGFLEMWEWEEIKDALIIPPGDLISLGQLNNYLERISGIMQWGTAMVWSNYKPVISLFREFEPLAEGYYDELVRSSVLLHMGDKLQHLSDIFSGQSGFKNNVFNIASQSLLRGINPGFAAGELVVIKDPFETINYSPNKIYVFRDAPSNLKPVGGILSITEGNPVSHIQLLAKNLGIPSAIINDEIMEQLSVYSGTEVFFAVSRRGTVLMKPTSDIDDSEKELFRKKKERDDKIAVPVERIHLGNIKILNLGEVNADHSGVICGPKAANLGQLKNMFPDHVVDGIVLPFGVFRQHMDQTIPGGQNSYWQYLTQSFDSANEMRKSEISEKEIEIILLQRLDSLRTLIRKMPFLPHFRSELEQQFITIFNKPLGKIPVFIRSDTNMEDLKDFTGAGLNLTVFNVLDSEKILQGIRDVWASPYTERSYKWRQHFLHNPENVFPSILIMPSVNADKSGVLITKGIISADTSDITIAFNRGVGGAVDGQAAESWQISAHGENRLIAPSRELTYLSIPETGGSNKVQTSFENRILTPENLIDLMSFSQKIREKSERSKNFIHQGPSDIELAFKDNKIWLFQIRPYIENKQAAASEYLDKISPPFDRQKMISLDLKI